MWIIQEVALGNSLRLFYGDCEVLPAALAVLVFAAVKEAPHIDQSSATFVSTDAMHLSLHRVQSIMGFRGKHRDEQSINVRQVFRAGTLMDSSDPRDRIFAMQELLAESTDVTIPRDVKPDYDIDCFPCISMSPDILFHRTTARSIGFRTPNGFFRWPGWGIQIHPFPSTRRAGRRGAQTGA